MADATIPVTTAQTGSRTRFGTTIVLGHALKHVYISALLASFLPEIKLSLGLSGTQVGSLGSAQHFSGWFSTVSSGYLGDRFTHKTGLLLGLSLGLIGIAYLALSLFDTFVLLFLAMCIMGAGVSLFHPPALGALSRRFADRRSFAISMHGAGGSLGEVLGPLIGGGLIAIMFWRDILWIGAFPAIAAAFAMWLLLRERGAHDESQRNSVREYFGAFWGLLGQRAIVLICLATSLRTGGQALTNVFLPVYLREDLGYAAGLVGVYLAMAQLAGIGSQPVMGQLTDRLGHKKVLIPALLVMAFLLLLIPMAGSRWELAIIVLALGGFLFSLHAILISAAASMAADNLQSSVVSLVYGASFLGSLAPIAAGVLADAFGLKTPFYLGAALVLLAALVLSRARIVPRSVTAI